MTTQSDRTVLRGHYELLTKIGEGGSGEVWRARDRNLGREVVIKRMRPNLVINAGPNSANLRNRFEREAKTMARIEHANIVGIYAIEYENDEQFIIMKLVKGLSVLDLLVKQGAFSAHEALRIANEALKGIAEAHDNHVVHRDIKPANILVDRKRNVLVTDFGIARDLASKDQMTRDQSTMGTDGYMAPEQNKKAETADRRADIYGMGATLYSMLTCLNPTETFFMDINPETEDLLKDIPGDIAAIIRKANAYLPKDRYQSAEEMRSDVEHALKRYPEEALLPFPEIPWLTDGEQQPVSDPPSSIRKDQTSWPTGVPRENNGRFATSAGTAMPDDTPRRRGWVFGAILVVALGSVAAWFVSRPGVPVVVNEKPLAVVNVPEPKVVATTPEPKVETPPVVVKTPEPIAPVVDVRAAPRGRPETRTDRTKTPKSEVAVTPPAIVEPRLDTPKATITGITAAITVTAVGMTEPQLKVRYRAANGTAWKEKAMTSSGTAFTTEIRLEGDLASGIAYYIEASSLEGKKRSGNAVAPHLVTP